MGVDQGCCSPGNHIRLEVLGLAVLRCSFMLGNLPRMLRTDHTAPGDPCSFAAHVSVLQGRLVLHGWYTDPLPFFDGPLDEEDALEPLNAALIPMFDTLQALPPVLGTMSVRLTVSGATGSVTDVAFLADTLVAPPAAAGGDLGGGLLDAATIRGAVQHTVVDGLKQAEFPMCEEGDTLITLPLVFE